MSKSKAKRAHHQEPETDEMNEILNEKADSDGGEFSGPGEFSNDTAETTGEGANQPEGETEKARRGRPAMDTSTVEVDPLFLEEVREKVIRLYWKPKHLYAFLLYEHNIEGVAAKAIRELVFPERVPGRIGYMAQLRELWTQGPLTDDELKEFLAAQGEKPLGRYKELLPFNDMVATIWHRFSGVEPLPLPE